MAGRCTPQRLIDLGFATCDSAWTHGSINLPADVQISTVKIERQSRQRIPVNTWDWMVKRGGTEWSAWRKV